MRKLLSDAGRSALRAFIGSVLVLAPGILAAPNLNQMYLLGVAALIAAFTAAVRAVQVFVPQLSFASLLPSNYAQYGVYLDSFARAFIGTLVTLLPGVLNAPDLGTAKSLAVAALVGAVTAGVRVVQGLFTKGEQPAPNAGLSG
jgi:hypothetical protein